MNDVCLHAAKRLVWNFSAIVAVTAVATGNALPAAAGTLIGRVTGVTDGDTIKLLVNSRQQYKIRLGEIDAPESGQPFGQSSKRMLSDLVIGKIVSVRVTDVDRFGRSVGVIAAGPININAEMVKHGGAWAFRRYLSDQRYLLWEAEARQARRGLWRLQSDQIEPPWEWRAAKRSNRTAPGPARSRRSAMSSSSQRLASGPAGRCGVKWKCAQMNSCAEAVYQLRSCSITRLDGDGDGVPCEKICG